MESKPQESRDKPQRTQSEKQSGDGGKFRADCDSYREISRRLPQNPFEGVPGDCGWGRVRLPSFLPATSIWPLLEQWFAIGNTKPTWRIRLLQPAEQTDIEPRPIVGTSEQTRCRSTAWRQTREWQFAMHCPEQLRPNPYPVLPPGCD